MSREGQRRRVKGNRRKEGRGNTEGGETEGTRGWGEGRYQPE
jgi:hypothetical protein